MTKNDCTGDGHKQFTRPAQTRPDRIAYTCNRELHRMISDRYISQNFTYGILWTLSFRCILRKFLAQTEIRYNKIYRFG
jgi:hypothetical protein